jgi:hypothetical protein
MELPILTDSDARLVMEAHFGAPFGTALRDEAGRYCINLGHNLDTGAADTIAVSGTSYEAALRELAESGAHLLSVPLHETTGLFARLLHQRARHDGAFVPRDAPLTLNDCCRLDDLNQLIPRLRERLRPEIASSADGIAGFNVEVYTQFMLHRIMAMVDGSASAWHARNGLASAILARGALESIAVWAKVTKDAERHLNEKQYAEYDNLVGKVFFGNKSEPIVPGLTPIHVLTAINVLDKDCPGSQRTYDHLCEIAHPNGESLFAITAWQDVGSVSLDPAASRGTLLGYILAALPLDITMQYLDRWDKHLAPLIGHLWRQAYGLSPRDT